MVSVRAALLAIGLILSLFPKLTAAPLLSEAETAEQEKGFDAAQHATTSFQAEIQQSLTLQGIDHPIISKGELFYLAPDRLLIRFSDPAGEWMRIAGKELEIKKAGQPVVRRDLTQGGSNATTLLDFFSSDSTRWHRDFNVSMRSSGNSLFVSLASQHKAGSSGPGMFDILTSLELPDYLVRSIHVSLKDGNNLDFGFHRARRNLAIDPSLFHTP